MLNYRYNSIHFVADARGTKMPGGNFLAEDALFCQKMAPVPAKRNGTRRKMQKFQIGTSIFPGFVL